jgi:nitrogen fixation protein NifZ
MSQPSARLKPAILSRVVHDPRRRSHRQGPDFAGERGFRPGDAVRSLTRVTNDGIYPHRDIGDTLVDGGDIGAVRERWNFLGEAYYTVEFFARSAVVIMRGQEMERAARRSAIRPSR